MAHMWHYQMANVMGGVGDDRFKEFEGYCCRAYNILRKHASQLTNLFILVRTSHHRHCLVGTLLHTVHATGVGLGVCVLLLAASGCLVLTDAACAHAGIGEG